MFVGLLNRLNASKVVLGMSALTFNFGSRFVLADLTPAQQSLMQHPIVKRVIIFCMYFVTTRDVLMSITLALVTIVALEVLLNEGSKFCIMPGSRCTKGAPELGRMPVLPVRPLTSMVRKNTNKHAGHNNDKKNKADPSHAPPPREAFTDRTTEPVQRWTNYWDYTLDAKQGE